MKPDTKAFQRERPVTLFRERTRAPSEPVKGEPEDMAVKYAESLFQDSMAYRDGDLQMQDRWEANRGWFVSNGRERGALSSAITHVNLIQEKINSLTAHATEADPTFQYRPAIPAGVNLVNRLNLEIPALWERNRGSLKFRRGVKANSVYGTHLLKVSHDPGYGDAYPNYPIREVPCFRFFPAPYASDIESAPWVIEVTPRSVEEIYNDYGIRVRPELEPDAEFPDISDALDDVQSRYGVTTGKEVHSDLSTTLHDMFPSNWLVGGRDKTGIVFQKELWINDAAMEANYWVDKTAEEGLMLRHGKTLKYPHGRVISWANGRKLYDEPAPYARPFVRFVDNPFPGFFWGLGEIPFLVNLQLLHDDTVDNMRMIHAYMANGRLLAERTSGLVENDMGNDPGEIWWLNRGQIDRVKWLPGLTPPAEYYTHVNKVEHWFDLVTGHFDVTRGLAPGGVTAARGIVALQRAASIRVKDRMREIEDALEDLGRMMASRVMQFSPTRAALPDPKSGEFAETFLSEQDRSSPYHLKVSVIGNLDDQRDREFQKMLLMHKIGAITMQRLIKESGLTATETILAELPDAMKQNMARMLAQQADEAIDAGGAASGISSDQRSMSRALRTADE